MLVHLLRDNRLVQLPGCPQINAAKLSLPAAHAGNERASRGGRQMTWYVASDCFTNFVCVCRTQRRVVSSSSCVQGLWNSAERMSNSD